jgi:subtilisin-like proprotein convertase family protein
MVVANLGDIPDRGSATLDIVIKTWAAGTVINTAVVRRDGVEANLANNAVLTVTTVDAPSTNFTFLASGAVSIPTAGSGPGTPYPSTLLVAGVAGPVTKVTATLSNLNHTYPDDLDILLVGPGGQKTMLMSDCGGSLDLVNVTLTFNDQAPGTLPDASLIGSGTYRPSDYARGETLPVPAPAGPYGTNLATYQNLNANGTWHLFVADDASGDGGSLAAGWFLTITASLPPLPGMALHAVMGSANTVHLSFDSLAGMTYVMDRKKSLDQPNWESMPPVVGTGATMTITDSLGGQTQQVYRLRME